MQWCEDPDKAVVMRQSGDEPMKCPGLHHPGKNKKEWP